MTEESPNEESPMEVDPEEVEKALKEAAADEPREVNVACRKASHLEGGRPGASNSDADLHAPKCEANRAKVVSDVMPDVSHTIYRCVDCGYTWSISTGGHFPY